METSSSLYYLLEQHLAHHLPGLSETCKRPEFSEGYGEQAEKGEKRTELDVLIRNENYVLLMFLHHHDTARKKVSDTNLVSIYVEYIKVMKKCIYPY